MPRLPNTPDAPPRTDADLADAFLGPATPPVVAEDRSDEDLADALLGPAPKKSDDAIGSKPAPLAVQSSIATKAIAPAPTEEETNALLNDAWLEVYNQTTRSGRSANDARAEAENAVRSIRMRGADADKTQILPVPATVLGAVEAAAPEGGNLQRTADAFGPRYFSEYGDSVTQTAAWRLAENAEERKRAASIRVANDIRSGKKPDVAKRDAQERLESGAPLFLPTAWNPDTGMAQSDMGADVKPLPTGADAALDYGAGVARNVVGLANMAKDVVDVPMGFAQVAAEKAEQMGISTEASRANLAATRAFREWTIPDPIDAYEARLAAKAERTEQDEKDLALITAMKQRDNGMIAGALGLLNQAIPGEIDPTQDGVLDRAMRVIVADPVEPNKPRDIGVPEFLDETGAALKKGAAAVPQLGTAPFRGDVDTFLRAGSDVLGAVTTPLQTGMEAISYTPEGRENTLGWWMRVGGSALAGLPTTYLARVTDASLRAMGAESYRRHRTPTDQDVGWTATVLPFLALDDFYNDYLTTVHNGDGLTTEAMRAMDTIRLGTDWLSPENQVRLAPGGSVNDFVVKAAMIGDLALPLDVMPGKVASAVGGTTSDFVAGYRAGKAAGMSRGDAVRLGGAWAAPSATERLVDSPEYRDARDKLQGAAAGARDVDAPTVAGAVLYSWAQRQRRAGANPLEALRAAGKKGANTAGIVDEVYTVLHALDEEGRAQREGRPDDGEAPDLGDDAPPPTDADFFGPETPDAAPSPVLTPERRPARQDVLDGARSLRTVAEAEGHRPIGKWSPETQKQENAKAAAGHALADMEAAWGAPRGAVLAAVQAAASYVADDGRFVRADEITDAADLERMPPGAVALALHRLRTASPAQVWRNVEAFERGEAHSWKNEVSPVRDATRERLREMAQAGEVAFKADEVDAYMAVWDRVVGSLLSQGVIKDADGWWSRFDVANLVPTDEMKARGARGLLDLTDPAKAIMALGETADLSTLFHESAHMLRQILPVEQMADVDGFVQQKWGGWTREAEEWFARQFEAVLMRGDLDVPAAERAANPGLYDRLVRALKTAARVIADIYRTSGFDDVDPIFERWMRSFMALDGKERPVRVVKAVDAAASPRPKSATPGRPLVERVEADRAAIVAMPDGKPRRAAIHKMLNRATALGDGWKDWTRWARDRVREGQDLGVVDAFLAAVRDGKAPDVPAVADVAPTPAPPVIDPTRTLTTAVKAAGRLAGDSPKKAALVAAVRQAYKDHRPGVDDAGRATAIDRAIRDFRGEAPVVDAPPVEPLTTPSVLDELPPPVAEFTLPPTAPPGVVYRTTGMAGNAWVTERGNARAVMAPDHSMYPVVVHRLPYTDLPAGKGDVTDILADFDPRLALNPNTHTVTAGAILFWTNPETGERVIVSGNRRKAAIDAILSGADTPTRAALYGYVEQQSQALGLGATPPGAIVALELVGTKPELAMRLVKVANEEMPGPTMAAISKATKLRAAETRPVGDGPAERLSLVDEATQQDVARFGEESLARLAAATPILERLAVLPEGHPLRALDYYRDANELYEAARQAGETEPKRLVAFAERMSKEAPATMGRPLPVSRLSLGLALAMKDGPAGVAALLARMETMAATEVGPKTQKALVAVVAGKVKAKGLPDSHATAIEDARALGVAAVERVQAEKDGQGLVVAPNGWEEPFIPMDDDGVLYQERSTKTDTPEFRRWFGDSKVVDAEGKPLVVHHATTAEFDTFDMGRSNGVAGAGAYFSDGQPSGNYGDRVMQVYLRIENPADLRGGDGVVFAKQKELMGTNMQEARNWPQMQRMSRDFRDALLRAGHDGVLMSGERPNETYYVAFRPEQIKSAIANRGTFDPGDPNILHQDPVYRKAVERGGTLETTPEATDLPPKAKAASGKVKESTNPAGVTLAALRSKPLFDRRSMNVALGYKADQRVYDAADLEARAIAWAVVHQLQAREMPTRYVRVGYQVSVPLRRAAGVRARTMNVLGDLPKAVAASVQPGTNVVRLSDADAQRVLLLRDRIVDTGWDTSIPLSLRRVTLADLTRGATVPGGRDFTTTDFNHFRGAVADMMSGALPYRGRTDRYNMAAHLVWYFGQRRSEFDVLPRDATAYQKVRHAIRSSISSTVIQAASLLLPWDLFQMDMPEHIRPLYEQMRRDVGRIPGEFTDAFEAAAHAIGGDTAALAALHGLSQQLRDVDAPVSVQRTNGGPSDLEVLRGWLFLDPGADPAKPKVSRPYRSRPDFARHDLPRVGLAVEQPITDVVAEVTAHAAVVDRVVRRDRILDAETTEALVSLRAGTLTEQQAAFLLGKTWQRLNNAARLGEDVLVSAVGRSGDQAQTRRLIRAESGLALDAYERFFLGQFGDPTRGPAGPGRELARETIRRKDPATGKMVTATVDADMSVEKLASQMGNMALVKTERWVAETILSMKVRATMERYFDQMIDVQYALDATDVWRLAHPDGTGPVPDMAERMRFSAAVSAAVSSIMLGADKALSGGFTSDQVWVGGFDTSLSDPAVRAAAHALIGRMGLRPDLVFTRKGVKGDLAPNAIHMTFASLATATPDQRTRMLSTGEAWSASGGQDPVDLAGRTLPVGSPMVARMRELLDQQGPVGQQLAGVLDDRQKSEKFLESVDEYTRRYKGDLITGGPNGVVGVALALGAFAGGASIPAALLAGGLGYALTWRPRIAAYATQALGALIQGYSEYGLKGIFAPFDPRIAKAAAPAARQSIHVVRMAKPLDVAYRAVNYLMNEAVGAMPDSSPMVVDGRVWTVGDVVTFGRANGLDGTQAGFESAERAHRATARIIEEYAPKGPMERAFKTFLQSVFGRSALAENYRKVYEAVDTYYRYAYFVRSLMDGENPHDALQRSLTATFDYSATAKVDRAMNDALLFWMYGRRTIDLTLRALATRPHLVLGPLRFMRAQDMTSGYGDQDEDYAPAGETVADYAQGRPAIDYLPIAGGSQSAYKVMMQEPVSVTAMRTVSDFVNVDLAALLGRAHPAVAMGFNVIGTSMGADYVSFFRRKPVTDDAYWTVKPWFVWMDQNVLGGSLSKEFGFYPYPTTDPMRMVAPGQPFEFRVPADKQLKWDAFLTMVGGVSTMMTNGEIDDRAGGPNDAMLHAVAETMRVIDPANRLGTRVDPQRIVDGGGLYSPAPDAAARIGVGRDVEWLRNLGFAVAPIRSSAFAQEDLRRKVIQAAKMRIEEAKRTQFETPPIDEIAPDADVRPVTVPKLGIDPGAPLGTRRAGE